MWRVPRSCNIVGVAIVVTSYTVSDTLRGFSFSFNVHSSPYTCLCGACLRTADVDGRKKPIVGLLGLRSPFCAEDFIVKNKAFIAAGTGIAKQLDQWLRPGQKKVLPPCQVDSPLHEICHVKLGGARGAVPIHR